MDFSRIYSTLERIRAAIASPAIPAGAATSSNQTTGAQKTQLCGAGPGYAALDVATATKQSDGSQKTMIMGVEGANQRQVKVNPLGAVNIDAPQLPAALDGVSLKVKEQSPLTGFALEAGGNLASIKGDMTTLAGIDYATDTNLADVLTSLSAGGDALNAINAPARGTRIPLATIVLAAETGVTEYALATGLPAGTEIDIVGVKGGLSAAPGAATWRIHASDVTGWTPLDYEEECYTSAATAVASPIGDSIPNNPAMLTVPVSGNIFVRIIPNAGTITGSVKIRIVRR
ncbi:MAG: hypothetical protein WC911_02005 [Thermoleophilia bacterium]